MTDFRLNAIFTLCWMPANLKLECELPEVAGRARRNNLLTISLPAAVLL